MHLQEVVRSEGKLASPGANSDEIAQTAVPGRLHLEVPGRRQPRRKSNPAAEPDGQASSQHLHTTLKRLFMSISC